jgi:putative endonuclease
VEDRGNQRQIVGKTGEDLACSYLESIGHRILERNWRGGHQEIDIISVCPDGIHFVEVKARRKNVQAPPQENVGRTKQKHLTKAALKYLNTKQGLPHRSMECFFDVIAVTWEGEKANIEWIPQAFIPLYI